MGIIKAQGTVITINDGTIAQVVGRITGYSGLDGEASENNTTTLASVAQEFELGLVDNGGFNLPAFFDPTDPGQLVLIGMRVTGVAREMVVTLSDGSTLTFNVLCKGTPVNGAVDGIVSRDYSLRITGGVTEVYA